MAWTTPKTDWTANDYFNYDDALRIYNNLLVLKEMTTELFNYDSLVTHFYIEQRIYNSEYYNYYYPLDVNPKNIIVTAPYKGDSNLKYLFINWQTILTKFYFLQRTLHSYSSDERATPEWVEFPTDYYSQSGGSYPRSYYRGYSLKNLWTNGTGSTTKIVSFMNWYGTFVNTSYFSYYTSNLKGYREYQIDVGNGFNNAPFYTYTIWNAIERNIEYIYNYFSADLEGE